MTGINIGGRAAAVEAYLVPYTGTYFDVGSGFNFNYVGMFTGPQTMSGPLTTPTASFVTEPALSPDGLLVAFIQAGAFWLMEPDGANLAVLYDSSHPGYAGSVGDLNGFQWAPDSTHLLFALQAAASGIEDRVFTIDVSTGTVTLLYTHSPSAVLYNPRYNPAQTKILFSVVQSSSVLQVWAMNADGSGAAQQETIPTQFGGIRTAWWEGDARFVWNDGSLVSPVYKGQDIGGGNIITLGSGAANSPRENGEALNPDGSGYLAIAAGLPTNTDVNSVAYDGSGPTDFMTLDVAINGNLFVTPVTRFFDRIWWDASGNPIWSAPLSDLTDQREETINGDGVGVNFGLSG